MVEVTDVYGVTRNYDSADARDKVRQTERETALLEAAQSGDFSAVTANVSGSDQRDVISEANRILEKYNALEGANTGDYSGASSDAPMLYIGGGQNANSYNRVFNEGKGYAVYDSVTEADGTQYLAVSGKNSSFIEKINTDGTRERVDSVSRINSTPDALGNVTKTGTRGKNVRRVLDAFSNLKT